MLIETGLLSPNKAARSGEEGSRDRSRAPVPSAPALAIVIPTLNERANIPLLVQRLADVLVDVRWEVIFVDDDSIDGTMEAIRILSRSDFRIRGIRRISRRGLSGAALEGILSTSAEFVAVMDADLQHDETQLVRMLPYLIRGEADVVVASRYLKSGNASLGLSKGRQLASGLAIQVAQFAFKIPLSDPMSGFFMLRRDIVEEMARELSPQGFKILVDILTSTRRPLRVGEIPIVFGPRLHGESKLDFRAALDYAGLVVAKLSGGFLSVRFLMFGLVGGSGLFIHLTILGTLLAGHIGFPEAQSAAMLCAMTSNYSLNNTLTYRDRRRRGWRFVTGLASFAVLCSVGMVAGVGLSTVLYQENTQWWVAGIAGALTAAIWNYSTTSTVTWPS